ncbi:MAG: transglycosylase SLT domain-containing protein [Caldilineaceae bacterium]
MKPYISLSSILPFLLALTLVSCGRDRADSAAATASVAQPSPTAAANTPNLAIKAASPTEIAPATFLSSQPSVAATSPSAPAVTSALTTSTLTASSASPAQLMNQAQTLTAQGKYTEARTLLQTLLSATDLPAAAAAVAQFELAKLYLADRLYGEALSRLDALLASPFWGDPVDAAAQMQTLSPPFQFASAEPLTTKLLFLRAQALSGLSRYQEAIAAYQELLAQYPATAEVTQAQIAINYAALGDSANAGDAYVAAADAAPDTISKVRLLEDAAASFRNAERFDRAAAAYAQILGLAQNAGYRADIEYRLGQTLAAAGNPESATEHWRAATAESPEHPSAYLALIELVNRNAPFDLYQRGYIDLQAEAWYAAIDAFEQYLASVLPDDARAGLAMHGMAQAYLGAEDFASALTVLERALTQYPTCTCVGQIWLDKAAVQAASGDTAGARRTYRTFARLMPDDPLAPEALWRSGVSALWDNNELEAVADLLALADTFPQSERAPDALYAIGLGAYRTKLWTQMRQMYGRLQEQYPEYKALAVGYWLGRAYAETGEPEKAQEQWRKLETEAPDVYYGILAQEGLQQNPLHISERMDNLRVLTHRAASNPDDDGSLAFAEAWLADWVEQSGVESLTALPASVAQDPDLALGRLLIDLNLRSDATRVLTRLYQRHRAEPALLFPLMLEFERLQLHRLALISAVTLMEASPARLVEETPVYLQQLAYPRPFVELVEQEAQANGIDPLLFFSLLRQESQFDDSARSVAAAQGLAQIIPDTAEWVADQLRYPNFTDELVYRPYVNIKFGAYYLAWARDYLDGNIISALVGYNAGPGNAQLWRTLSGADDALFVEVLGVNEPRVYIYNILSNYYHYTRLYAAE